jgi:tetratricopeptide (TPR) repeat protein
MRKNNLGNAGLTKVALRRDFGKFTQLYNASPGGEIAMRFLLTLLLLVSMIPCLGCSPSPKTQSDEDVSVGKQKEAAANEEQNIKEDTEMNPNKMTLEDPKLRQEAMAEFDKAIQADPKNPKAYYARGFAILSHGKEMDKSITDFDKAIELDPKYAKAYLMRGRAYEALGDTDRAKADRAKALELEPGID